MSRESLKTLFHPFVTEAVALPGAESRWLFLGAEAGFSKPEGFDAELTVVQDFRPEFRRLEASHLKPLPTVDGNGYDGALLLCGKHKGVNEDRIAEALQRVKPGGTVLVAAPRKTASCRFASSLIAWASHRNPCRSTTAWSSGSQRLPTARRSYQIYPPNR